MSPFRALHLDPGQEKDAHGCGIGSDWRVIRVSGAGDQGHHEVTTDGVHASDYGFLVPGTDRALARLIAVALNEAFERRSHAEWTALLDECAQGEPPPEPQEPVICEVCGEEGATCWTLPAGDPEFHPHHPGCRLPGDTDDLPF